MGTPLRFHRRFLPFERDVLRAARDVVPTTAADLFSRQVESINKIQRILEWNEVEFYCMRLFKVAWPAIALFPNRGERELVRATVRAGERQFSISLFMVGGHIFSLESKQAMKPLRASVSVTVSDVQLLEDPMRDVHSVV